MIASLPMYWRDENVSLWKGFWREVQRRIDLPDLLPPEALPDDWADHWLSPDLALSMTCGLPFRTALKAKVAYVGTFGFGLDCKHGFYFSQVIAGPAPLPKPLRLAVNAPDSQSGWAARFGAGPQCPEMEIAEHVETGSHAGSLAAVAEGRADAAYLDAVTWRILKRVDPNAARVRLAGRTKPTPGLPLIAAKGADVDQLRHALHDALSAYRAKDPMLMGGKLSFHVFDEALYHALPVPPPLQFPRNPS